MTIKINAPIRTQDAAFCTEGASERFCNAPRRSPAIVRVTEHTDTSCFFHVYFVLCGFKRTTPPNFARVNGRKGNGPSIGQLIIA